MAISRFKTSTLAQGLPKYQDVWDGISTLENSDWELISTVTIGAGGSTGFSFTSIPSTYKDLKIIHFNISSASASPSLRFNNDSGSNYARTRIVGTNTTVGTLIGTPLSNIPISGNAGFASPGGGGIIDILDYTRNGYKIARMLSGIANTTLNGVAFETGMWTGTSAISTINVDAYTTNDMLQHSTWSLYGIKG